jgi:hypothetical protein
MPLALFAALGTAVLMQALVDHIEFKEKTMNAAWIIPFIIIGGALQSCGAAMNGQLNKYVVNPWIASTISFALITFFFLSASLIMPHPLPTQRQLEEMLGGQLSGVWWAPYRSMRGSPL